MSFNNIAIRVSELSKYYQIYESPYDRLKQFFMPRLRRLFRQEAIDYYREFVALKDVSFDIKKGETFGIVGRNGAGKSTLLQIICGTLTPSAGVVNINGRVAALLELGSGFNSEFTGRENVYMNATVLGLTKEEIDGCFEDIVKFADIGEFLDQPVKTYSSGMYVRLAFSVVVHVDADILIVDEALSVGDMYFQSKCMMKMKELMSSGVTILFVSHDVGAVKAICSRAIYLENGEITAVGSTDQVIESYYGAGVKSQQYIESQPNKVSVVDTNDCSKDAVASQMNFSMRAEFNRLQNGMAELINVMLLSEAGQALEVFDFGQEVVLRIDFRANKNIQTIGLAYHIRDKNGLELIYSDTGIESCHTTNLVSGDVVSYDWKFKLNLREGDYSIAVMLSIPQDLSIAKVEVCDFVPLAINFKVGRGKSLPVYGAVYWDNKVSKKRFNTFNLDGK
jgi:lipopolysaccharide transport system ATP-binding protein